MFDEFGNFIGFSETAVAAPVVAPTTTTEQTSSDPLPIFDEYGNFIGFA
jgi:hypothetical protein